MREDDVKRKEKEAKAAKELEQKLADDCPTVDRDSIAESLLVSRGDNSVISGAMDVAVAGRDLSYFGGYVMN
jgi:hypothetical protein